MKTKHTNSLSLPYIRLTTNMSKTSKISIPAKSLDKFSLCVLMTQSGKTFVAIDHILKKLEEDPYGLHVVYTMNTLLNNAQFANRLSTVEETYGKGSIVVFASKYSGSYDHAVSKEDLEAKTRITMPRVVIMCSHHVRFREGHDWVASLGESHMGLNVHMIYDELHQYIKRSIRKDIETLHGMDHVASIMALTATPKVIIHKRGPWSTLKLISHNDQFNFEGYTRVGDMKMHHLNDYFPETYIKPVFNDFDKMDEETLGFMEHALDRHPEILADGNRVFLPAHVRRSGHITVRDLVLERNPEAVVVIVNAKEKSLIYMENEKVQRISLISKDMELSENIGRILTEYGLMERTLVITGFLCVGMGQTLTHKSYGNFTHAIISHMSVGNDAIYQLFGRLTGRTKAWDTYRETQVYCPRTISNRVKVMEKCAESVFHELKITRPLYQLPVTSMPEGVDVTSNDRKLKLNGLTGMIEEEEPEEMYEETD